MTEEEHLDNLRNSGRNTAIEILKSATTKAENVDQMNNQIYVARWLAIHLLACEGINAEKQCNKNRKDYLKEIVGGIAAEMQTLSKMDLELYMHKGTAEA